MSRPEEEESWDEDVGVVEIKIIEWLFPDQQLDEGLAHDVEDCAGEIVETLRLRQADRGDDQIS